MSQDSLAQLDEGQSDLTADLFPELPGAVIEADATVTEDADSPGWYVIAWATNATGRRRLNIKDAAGNLVANFSVVLAGAGSTSVCFDPQPPYDTGVIMPAQIRSVRPGTANVSIVVTAVDDNGDPVTLTEASAGLTMSYVVVTNGIAGAPVPMTPVARSATRVHTDGAISHIGEGRHEIDVPDLAFVTDDTQVYVVLEADGVDAAVSERVHVSSGLNTPAQPYSSHAPQRVDGTKLTAFVDEDGVTSDVSVYDADDDPLDLTGLDLEYVVSEADETIIGSAVPFTGAGTSFTLTVTAAMTADEKIDGNALKWSMRRVSTKEVLAHGRLEIKSTARP